MSKASGILLITLGIGVAAYAMPSHDQDSEQQPQEISLAKAAPTEVAEVGTAVRSPKVTSPDIVPPIPKPALRPVKDSTEPKNVAATPAKSTFVATAQRTQETAMPAAPKPVLAIVPGDRTGLVRELQRELRRVGCYDGEVNGTWTPAARRAMKVFTDRVNASLPVDQPDYILLKLVQGSSERTCGAGCPAGQGAAADGRCLPNAVIAQASKKSTGQPATTVSRGGDGPLPTTSGWATTTTVATRDMPAVPEGRMALSGPGNESPSAQRLTGEDLARAPDVDPAKGKVTGPRKPKLAAVDNSDRRTSSEPRKKFGPWFFRQQDASRN